MSHISHKKKVERKQARQREQPQQQKSDWWNSMEFQPEWSNSRSQRWKFENGRGRRKKKKQEEGNKSSIIIPIVGWWNWLRSWGNSDLYHPTVLLIIFAMSTLTSTDMNVGKAAVLWASHVMSSFCYVMKMTMNCTFCNVSWCLTC